MGREALAAVIFSSSFIFMIIVWFEIFSCCLQKPKAVCPLPYLTSKVPPNRHHFKASDFGSFPKDIFPNTISQASFSNSFFMVSLVLNALTSLQAERIDKLDMFVEVLFFYLFFVFAVVTVPRPNTHPLHIYLLFDLFIFVLKQNPLLLLVDFSHFEFFFSVAQSLPYCLPALTSHVFHSSLFTNLCPNSTVRILYMHILDIRYGVDKQR